MELMKCKFQCPQIMLYWNIAIHFHIICDCLQAPGRSWVVVTHGASDVCSPVLSRESLQPLFCSVLGPVLGIGATGLFPLVCVTKTTSWGCLKPQKWIPSEVRVSVGPCCLWVLPWPPGLALPKAGLQSALRNMQSLILKFMNQSCQRLHVHCDLGDSGQLASTRIPGSP